MVETHIYTDYISVAAPYKSHITVQYKYDLTFHPFMFAISPTAAD